MSTNLSYKVLVLYKNVQDVMLSGGHLSQHVQDVLLSGGHLSQHVQDVLLSGG